MSQIKKDVIKIEQQGKSKTKFTKALWFGYGPISAEMNKDGTLKVQFPDQEPEVLVSKEGKYGNYFQASVLGGVAFIEEKNHDKYGHYLRCKLSDDVVFPPEVAAKMSDKTSRAPASDPTTDKTPESLAGGWFQ